MSRSGNRGYRVDVEVDHVTQHAHGQSHRNLVVEIFVKAPTWAVAKTLALAIAILFWPVKRILGGRIENSDGSIGDEQ